MSCCLNEPVYDSLLCAGSRCVVSSSAELFKMKKHSNLIHSTGN